MKKYASFLVLLAGILWGMIGIFVRRLNVIGFGSMEIVAIRALSTAILLGAFLFVYDKQMLKIRLKHVWCFVGTGIFSIVFFNYCYFKAMTLTSLSVAAVLLYTAPAIVMLLSAFLFHEKITIVKVVSLLATFIGCVLVSGVVGYGNDLNVSGIVMGLGAGLGYALYSIFSRYALERKYHPFTISFYTFLFALVGTLPLCNRKLIIDLCTKQVGTVLFCLVFGLVSTVIPYIVYTLGLKELENGQAAIIASIEPVAATVLGVIVFQEKMSLFEILGMLFVLSAIVMCNIKIEKKVSK